MGPWNDPMLRLLSTCLLSPRLLPFRLLTLALCLGPTLAQAAEAKRVIGRAMEARCDEGGTCTLVSDRASFGRSNLPEGSFLLRRGPAPGSPILFAFSSTVEAGGTVTFVFGTHSIVLQALEKRPAGSGADPYYVAEIPMNQDGMLVLAALENAQNGKAVFSSLGSPSRVLTVDLRDVSKLMQEIDAYQKRPKTDGLSWRYRAP